MKLRKKTVVFDLKDNVATALADFEAETNVEVEVAGKSLTVKLINSVPFGHKFSLTQIKSGSSIIKYGEIIGSATNFIQRGEYVHVHNIASNRGRGDLREDAK